MPIGEHANELGDLVIAPVCVKSVTQADALAVCASDTTRSAGHLSKGADEMVALARQARRLVFMDFDEIPRSG
jgi:hypothetical protein